MNSNISILILAAGASRRMNEVKQLMPWGPVSIIEHIVTNAMSTGANGIYAVLGAHRDLIVPKLKPHKVTLLKNENWEAGMGNSIAAGVEGILETQKPDGILILLADQPLIDRTYIHRMIETFLGANSGIIGTQYSDKIGVPALFGARYFTELLNMGGEHGAALLIENNLKDCIALNPDGKELDMDTQEDYNRIRSNK
ncbi:MAG: nucleotidyltransferase family protein [Flavobacteriaceae bacterium]